MPIGLARIGVAPKAEPARYFKKGAPGGAVEGTGKARVRNGRIEIEVIEGRHVTFTDVDLLTASGYEAIDRVRRAEKGLDLEP